MKRIFGIVNVSQTECTRFADGIFVIWMEEMLCQREPRTTELRFTTCVRHPHTNLTDDEKRFIIYAVRTIHLRRVHSSFSKRTHWRHVFSPLLQISLHLCIECNKRLITAHQNGNNKTLPPPLSLSPIRRWASPSFRCGRQHLVPSDSSLQKHIALCTHPIVSQPVCEQRVPLCDSPLWRSPKHEFIISHLYLIFNVHSFI